MRDCSVMRSCSRAAISGTVAHGSSHSKRVFEPMRRAVRQRLTQLLQLLAIPHRSQCFCSSCPLTWVRAATE